MNVHSEDDRFVNRQEKLGPVVVEDCLRNQLVVEQISNFMFQSMFRCELTPSFAYTSNDVFDLSAFALQARAPRERRRFVAERRDCQLGETNSTVQLVRLNDVVPNFGHVLLRFTAHGFEHRYVQDATKEILHSTQVHYVELVCFRGKMANPDDLKYGARQHTAV